MLYMDILCFYNHVSAPINVQTVTIKRIHEKKRDKTTIKNQQHHARGYIFTHVSFQIPECALPCEPRPCSPISVSFKLSMFMVFISSR